MRPTMKVTTTQRARRVARQIGAFTILRVMHTARHPRKRTRADRYARHVSVPRSPRRIFSGTSLHTLLGVAQTRSFGCALQIEPLETYDAICRDTAYCVYTYFRLEII